MGDRWMADGGHLQVAGHVFSRQALNVHEVQDPLRHRLCGGQTGVGDSLAGSSVVLHTAIARHLC